MASLIRWLRFNRKSKREEKVNFLINSAQQQKFKVSQFTGHFVCLNLRIEFCEYSIITVFKHEESVKTGVDSTHIQGACGGDFDKSTNSGCFSLTSY